MEDRYEEEDEPLQNSDIIIDDDPFAFELEAAKNTIKKFSLVSNPKSAKSDLWELTQIQLMMDRYKEIPLKLEEYYGHQKFKTVRDNLSQAIAKGIKRWSERNLDSTFPFIWLETIQLTLERESDTSNKIVPYVVGINSVGKKEFIGFYPKLDHKNPSCWQEILGDLKKRGVEKIHLISSKIEEIGQACKAIYPAGIHLRNIKCLLKKSQRMVSQNHADDLKQFKKELKAILDTMAWSKAEEKLGHFNKLWAGKYPQLVSFWEANRDSLKDYYSFHPLIRKILYASTFVETFHAKLEYEILIAKEPIQAKNIGRIFYLANDSLSMAWKQSVPSWERVSEKLSMLEAG